MRRIAFALVLFLAACEHRPVQPLVIQPIGTVSPELLEHLRRELPPALHREVIVAAPIALPASALDAQRNQYLGSAILDELKRHDTANADRILGVLDADAYAPGLNFIFGQSTKPGRFSFIALARLRGRDPSRLHDRAAKIAIHEVGHAFGFAHCENEQCVMHFANSLAEADRTGTRFCERERIPR